MKQLLLHIVAAIFALWSAATFLSNSPILFAFWLVCFGGATSFFLGRRSPFQFRARAIAYSVSLFLLGLLVGVASGAELWGLAALISVSGFSYVACYIAGSIGGRKPQNQSLPGGS